MRQVGEGGLCKLAECIELDLATRCTGLQKPHIPALSDLVACALTTQSANTGDWKAQLPRRDCQVKSRERFISRFLSNSLIQPLAVMAGFVPQLLNQLAQAGQTVVLMLDQSKISNGFECLMLSARVGCRALPISWRIIKTEGAIGFDIQKDLLNSILPLIPDGLDVLLAGDRFYGTAALIDWCQRQGWQYRIRLKGNLILQHQGGEISTGEAAKLGLSQLQNARLGKVTTHIGILHEAQHPEPWIIAMNELPTKGRILDYGLRWGIEALFSDFKSRGFGVTQTQLEHPDRIERLLLVLSVAMYWAVSTGMHESQTQPKQTQKKHAVA